jgi:hypothetical protein
MKAWTRVKFVDDHVALYPEPLKSEESASPINDRPIAEIATGSNGFIEAILPDGRRGFVDSQVRVVKVTQMGLLAPQASLHEAASAKSAVVAILKRGTILTRLSSEPALKNEGVVWISVSTANGQRGFVLGNVKVDIFKPRLETTPADGAKNMAIGGGICVIGIIITAVTYSSASSSGGRFVVAWGAILFGGIRLLWGMLQAAGVQIR